MNGITTIVMAAKDLKIRKTSAERLMNVFEKAVLHTF